MHLWNMFVAAILGLVEGLTEFAPVSSTGHMIIVDDLILKSNHLYGVEAANVFKVVIQMGSILAAVVVFWDRFLNLLGLKKNITKEQLYGERLKLTQVIVGLLPAAVLGFLFENYIDSHLFSIKTVLFALVAGAILMIAADLLRPRRPKTETVDQITYTQAFLIGLFQCLSLWPGFSRSGSTISGGVLLGLSHRAASDFTFIMAVPIMFGASFLSLVKHWDAVTAQTIPFFIVGFISAFIFALLAIRFFLKLINKVKLIPFAVYRIIVAVVLFVLFVYQ
ncbi:undecaprenyl-diphosphate phosphatase [Weizmannia acidilactici]|uniref:undecaprenyl-diphosphate phosphatase n=1 Tax=Weizmannia acidilactici TaxID=2607726 RepID=UPI00124EE7A8|nr:undecaprenyl-diphosphate phosphatase [Weizmannia acidilactici]GER66715.1 undecaprenyl-diphosphatase [Weizmannia acidilactici]GER72869.1 undecaprenyl-diphosphatase [Weizmannia acidilactici]